MADSIQQKKKQQKKKYEPLRIGNLTASIPVIQGGMGVGISLSSLAGHVAKNGGIGIISTAQIGYRKKEWDTHPLEANLQAVSEEIKKAREIASDGIIGVNIMVATKNYEAYVRAAIEAGVDLIISGAGLPVELPKYAEGTEVKLAPIVSSVKALELISKYWIKKYNRVMDLVVIEGPLAGGHLGFKKEELQDIKELHYEDEIRRIIEQVRDLEKTYHCRIPVVVAGGIYDGNDMKRVMALGADGVQVATRFVTTYECDAAQAFKDAYLAAKKEDIVIVKSPVGMPGRAIHNSFLEKVKMGSVKNKSCHQCLKNCDRTKLPYCITDALVNAARGNTEDALLFCGANAYKAEQMEHVADIMKEFESI